MAGVTRAILTGVFTMLAACAAGAVAAQEDLVVPVDRFQGTLIAVMKDGAALGFTGRRDRIAPMVDEQFDIEGISRAVIGRHYDALLADERDALTKRIRTFAIATLASRFARHDGEQFESPAVQIRQGPRARVHCAFVAADGARTDLAYDVIEAAGRWRIANVWFDGVSGTDIQRAEFETFLRSGGARRLLEQLDRLIASLGAGGG